MRTVTSTTRAAPSFWASSVAVSTIDIASESSCTTEVYTVASLPTRVPMQNNRIWQKCLEESAGNVSAENEHHEGKARKTHAMRLTLTPKEPATAQDDVAGTLPLIKIVGCGNLYAGDDAVGPLVIERLTAAKLPRQVSCFDAGTSGIDAALAFDNASDVIMIDACQSGQPPGTVFELNQQEIASLAKTRNPNFHTLRWDQAIAVAGQFCQSMPKAITVFLVEGQSFSLGDPVTPAVAGAVEELAAEIINRFRQQMQGDHQACCLAERQSAERQSAERQSADKSAQHDLGAS